MGILRRPGGRNVGLVGCGDYLPARVVGNAEICRDVDSSDEWIRSRTGIRERRFAGDGETVPVMAAAAARNALRSAGKEPADIGCVIVATSTHLLQTPSAAALVAEVIGANNAAAFDLSAGCSGFTHGLAIANDMIAAGTSDYMLVIGV